MNNEGPNSSRESTYVNFVQVVEQQQVQNVEGDPEGSCSLGFKNVIKVDKGALILLIDQKQVSVLLILVPSGGNTLKGFSIINEMNKIIEVGGALRYDVK